MKNVNSSLFGIHEIGSTGRQLLIGYQSFISLSALIGDTLVLIGTLKYNAIQLHDILIIFIQNIAVADILLTVFNILPGIVSLAANDWILGDILCHASYFVNANCGLIITLLISALAATKVLIVKYPLRALTFSSRIAHISAGSMWICSFIIPAAAIAKDKQGVTFDLKVYNCLYNCRSETWTPMESVLFDIAWGMTVFTSTVVTVVSSVVLIVLAKRAADRRSGGLQWRGVLTVLLTASLHLLISIPFFIYFIASFYFDQRGELPLVYVDKIATDAWILSYLVVAVNFFIITLTLSSFRDFLKRRIKIMIAPLTRCCTANENQGPVEEGERRRLL